MSSPTGSRPSRARTRAGARPSSSAAGRGRARERGSENHFLAAAQILLGVALSGLIGFVCCGILLAVVYLIYSAVK